MQQAAFPKTPIFEAGGQPMPSHQHDRIMKTPIIARLGKQLLIAFLCAAIGILTATIFMRGFYPAYFLPNALYGLFIGYPLWTGNAWLSEFISRRFPWNRKPALTLGIDVIVSMTYSLAVIVLVNWAWFSWFAKTLLPLKIVLNQGFWQVMSVFIITVMISFFLYARSFFTEWRNAAVAQEALKRQAAVAQFEMLKNQVNPHFLFNSLNVLTGLVETEPANAVRFIRKLSDVYRYLLENRDQETVEIQKELEFIRAYVFLLQIRFRDALTVNIEDGLNGFSVLPVALQMLIENAVKHNVVSQAHPLIINIRRDDNYLIIENGFQPRQSAESNGLGLSNIRERYAWLSSLPPLVENKDGFFRVKLPLLHPKTDNLPQV